MALPVQRVANQTAMFVFIGNSAAMCLLAATIILDRQNERDLLNGRPRQHRPVASRRVAMASRAIEVLISLNKFGPLRQSLYQIRDRRVINGIGRLPNTALQ